MDSIITLLVSSVSFILALFVLTKNFKSATNVYFALLLILIGSYPIFNFLSLHSINNENAFFWAKCILYISIPVGPLFYFFVKAYPNPHFIFNKKIQITIIIWSLINIVLAYLNLIFKSVTIINNSPQISPGSAVASFGLLQLICISLASWTLVQKYHQATGLLKVHLKFIMSGIIVSLALTIFSTMILAVFFGNTNLVSISPLFLLIAGITVAYTIARHRLLDIGFLVARSVTYTLILIVIGGVYTLYFLITGSIIFKVPFIPEQFVFYGVIIFIVAFTFQPVRSILERITDAVFYRGHYNQQKLLEALSKIMSETIDLKTLTASILDKVLPEMRITRGVFVLLKKHDHGYIDYIEYKGYEKSPIFTKSDIEPFLKDNIIIFEDLEEGELKTEMRKINVSVALPLKVHDERIGVLFFSDKASGDIYSQQDINVLEILAPQLSVAIQNSKEYEEIKMFNVTLKKEIEIATKDLKDANERLKSLDKLKDEFVSLASHELRTPMTVVKQYLWMVLAGREGPLTDKQKTFLDRAYQSTEELLALVNDMLDVSRIEANKITLDLKPLSLTDTVKQLVSELNPRSQELGVPIHIAPFKEIPQVIADSGKLKEVLTNLLGNSLKYTPRGGSITVNFSSKEGTVEVDIADTGVGIKKEDLPKLFQKFGRLEQGKELTRERLESTGLGLYIVKSIVELHGGKIWVSSEGENKGSTFSFTLLEDTEENRKKFPTTSSN